MTKPVQLPNATLSADIRDDAEKAGNPSASAPDLSHDQTPDPDLDRLLRARGLPSPDSSRGASASGVVVGILVALLENRTPMVTYPGQAGTAAVAAKTTVGLTSDDIGGEVVLQFEAGDPERPIILGRLQSPGPWPLAEQPAQVQVDADGRRLVVEAKEEITMRCGKASITLTKAGKVIVEGTYVLNKSSGVMRIKGGSVQVN